MGTVTIFLCGDVMTGRGVDQILPHPGDARLHEEYVKDARQYVRLAEAASGPVPRYRGTPILHGCGDFLDDYEGIVGYEEFRGDLALRPFSARIKLTDDGTLALRPS